MPRADAFENRLAKNARHFAKWARTVPTNAYRVYDRDMPEWPYSVDWYDGRVQLVEYPSRRQLRSGSAEELREQAASAVARVLGVDGERLYVKSRRPMVWGEEQYGRLAARPQPFVVEEQGLHFEVDLASHLDTGLFLDHRITRARVRNESSGRRVLNLFCYTGAFTVYAADGGARETVSVDLSNTYLDWAERNLRLNGLQSPRHRILRGDVVRWLQDARQDGERFDLIVLDPPSFSMSKAARTFEVQKDHPRLVTRAADLLAAAGVLYFSTNFRGFSLDERALAHLDFDELTPKSIPPDFRQRDVHRCWRVTRAVGDRGRYSSV